MTDHIPNAYRYEHCVHCDHTENGVNRPCDGTSHDTHCVYTYCGGSNRVTPAEPARESDHTPSPAVVESEHVEWGVRWPDGSITLCGWMDGHSEAWARRSLLPTERLVNPQQQVGEAVVRRNRTVFADAVTDWEDVPMTDHTPSPATDGLRTRVEALLNAALSPDAVVRELRALLAARPAPPSETATEGTAENPIRVPVADFVQRAIDATLPVSSDEDRADEERVPPGCCPSCGAEVRCGECGQEFGR